ncbi:MAG: lysylphosphatidylglycerol synthase transmembrane domain-containing protein [Candidatus Omnitrophica bacterium]|nr:lysylphosphatidylglycerol synthase transmembrane domain-containing protein [Candidatus Omnitrophota bacterium]
MKKALNIGLRVSVSILLLFFLFSKVNIEELRVTISKADPVYIIAAFLLLLFLYLLALIRWDMLLRGVMLHIPLRRVAVSFLGGNFFNLFLPSTIGGDVVRSMDLVIHTRSSKEVVATVLLDRISGFVGLVSVAIVALLLGYRYISDEPVVFFIIAAVAFILLALIIVLFNERVFLFVNSLLKSHHEKGIRAYLKNLHQEIYHFRSRSAVITKNFFISVAIQAMTPLIFWLTARALGADIPLIYFFIFVPVVTTITILPVSIGGLGLRDMSTVFFFTKVGMAHNAALAMSLINFGFLLLAGIAGGIVYAFALHSRWLQRRKKARLS